MMHKLLAYHKIEKSYHGDKKTISSSLQIPADREFLEEAMFAGGSFWRVEAAFGCVVGVLKTSTGYYGGTLRKPTYREVLNVSNANTGHTETVKVDYDKGMISFTTLCEVFWKTHDPTYKEFLQFGLNTHLNSAIFYANEEQRREALKSKVRRQMKLNRRIVTVILPDSLVACKLNGFLAGECIDVKRHKEKLRSFVDSHDISENIKEILLVILESWS